jgi:stress response protein YsnF
MPVVLHDEQVLVERRPISGSAPADALSDAFVEATETTERAVVRKGVRLKEEVVLRLQTTERKEKVRGTVRRDEVEIQKPRELKAPAVVQREEVSAPGATVEKRAQAQR